MGRREAGCRAPWKESMPQDLFLTGFNVWAFREVLGEDFNEIFIIFMLVYQNEFKVWLANTSSTNWISAICLHR